MKQTATEWLEEHFKTLIQEDKKGLYKLLFEQAKEMEKEQIIDAHIHAQFNVVLAKKEFAEQYYKETIKTE